MKRVFSGGSISEMIVRTGACAERQYNTELTRVPKRKTTASTHGSARCQNCKGGAPGGVGTSRPAQSDPRVAATSDAPLSVSLRG